MRVSVEQPQVPGLSVPRRRAKSYARRRAQRRYWEIVQPHVVPLAVATVGWYATVILLHVVAPRFLGDVLLGALLMVPVCVLPCLVMSDPSAAYWSRGADAEEWTSTALRRLLPSHVVFDDVQLGHTNADHVIVGRVATIVVETKWSSKPWADRYGDERARVAVKQAKQAAGLVERRFGQAGIARSVVPLVVLWGGGVSQWSKERSVRTFDGVSVVAGPHLSAWASSLRDDMRELSPIDESAVRAVFCAGDAMQQ